MAEAAVADAPRTDAPVATDAAQAEPAAPVWAPDPRLAPPAAEPPAATDQPQAQTEPPAADATPAEGEGAGAEPPTAAEWKAKLDAGDADLLKELLSHPKLAGHIGTLADRIAAKKADDAAQAAREAELDRAAQEDPDNPLAQERLRARQTELQQLSEHTARLGAFTAAQQGVADFIASLPADARTEIAKLAPEGKAYGQPGDLKSALSAYMADVVAGAVAADRAAQRAAWEKEVLPGLRKEVQAELMTADRAPDLGVGATTASSAAGLTPERVASMSAAEFNKFIAVPANKVAYDALWATAMAKK